tara:strand:- start:1042 stop:2229 length:1188 start_codon:yes stop_codon:yes gene_type:complete
VVLERDLALGERRTLSTRFFAVGKRTLGFSIRALSARGLRMKPTDQTLIEKMRITEVDIASRKSLLGFGDDDVEALIEVKSLIEQHIEELVSEFYARQTSTPEIAALIGDADTLSRLQLAQRRYVLDLFEGRYGLEYVNNRLRIGLVHKRIGVEPKLYLSAVHLISSLLVDTITLRAEHKSQAEAAIRALFKLISFDVTLIFETYIQGMVSEVEVARKKTEEYAQALQATIVDRTNQLRTDALTGLTARRYLDEGLARILQSARRRSEPVTIVFIDVNGFKKINDSFGHVHGDEVLKGVGLALREVARSEDICSRYGGDEFCVVLSNSTRADAEKNYCQRVHDLIAQRMPGVSVSMGVAQTGPQEFLDIPNLFKTADERMYQEKAKTRAGLLRAV